MNYSRRFRRPSEKPTSPPGLAKPSTADQDVDGKKETFVVDNNVAEARNVFV
jgi:hypothetical protein